MVSCELCPELGRDFCLRCSTSLALPVLAETERLGTRSWSWAGRRAPQQNGGGGEWLQSLQ